MYFVVFCTSPYTILIGASLCNQTKMAKYTKSFEKLLNFCAKGYTIQLRKRLRDLNLTNKELRTRRYGFDERHR